MNDVTRLRPVRSAREAAKFNLWHSLLLRIVGRQTGLLFLDCH
jgi:hypothetical protein